MKKSNEFFNMPQRQSQWAIIFIIIRSLRKMVIQLWPLVIAAFMGRSGGTFEKYEIIASGLGLFGMVASVISYYRFYFHVSDDELVIKQGIIKKVNLNIPFERIQSINFRQTLLHRLLQVTTIEMETAGSKDQETKIDALSIPQAEELRKLLLEKRAAALGQMEEEGTPAVAQEVVTVENTILTLSPRDLLKVGLTRNHFAPIGLLISIIATGTFYAFTLELSIQSIFEQVWDYVEDLSFYKILILSILVLVFAVIVSVIKKRVCST